MSNPSGLLKRDGCVYTEILPYAKRRHSYFRVASPHKRSSLDGWRGYDALVDGRFTPNHLQRNHGRASSGGTARGQRYRYLAVILRSAPANHGIAPEKFYWPEDVRVSIQLRKNNVYAELFKLCEIPL